MNDSTDLVHCDVAGFRGMMNDFERKIYKLHEYKNGIMMFVNNENIIQMFEKINRSVSDPTFDPEDRLMREFQLTYHYTRIFEEWTKDFSKYTNEMRIFNENVETLSPQDRMNIRPRYIDAHSFVWYRDLCMCNITDESYRVAIEYVNYFLPKLNKTTEEVKTNEVVKKPKKKSSPKKKKIPATVKNTVWNLYNDKNLKIGDCFVCKGTILFESFHCGHVQAEANGGDVSIDNLRPICGLCNSSMGTTNMDEFIERYGFGTNENYQLDRDSSIQTVLEKLNKSDRKKVINILYKSQVCSLEECG